MLTLASILAAMSVVILGVGAIFEFLDLTMAAIASLLVVLSVIEQGGAYPYLVYAVTSVLSMLLPLPSKTPALLYLFFAGYYPIVKAALEKRLPRGLAMLPKILVFNIGLALMVFLSLKIFTTGLMFTAPWQYALLLLGTPVFVLYDVALTRLITVYLLRYRERFRFLHK